MKGNRTYEEEENMTLTNLKAQQLFQNLKKKA